jgi:hypothetical protein
MGGFMPLGFITATFSRGVCAKPAKRAIPIIAANEKLHAHFFMPFLLFICNRPIIPLDQDTVTDVDRFSLKQSLMGFPPSASPDKTAHPEMQENAIPRINPKP